jgi:RNA polymerase sigma-B factor
MLDNPPRHDEQLDDQLARLAGLAGDDPRRDGLRRQVIEHYLPLADRLARRYARRGDQGEDLTQVARLGLVKAVDGFKPDLGAFLGYAVPTIQGELKRYFRDQCWDIRPPRRLQELRAAAHAAADALTQRLGHSPTVPELAREIGAAEDDVIEALDSGGGFTVASLNAPARDVPDTCELGELVGAADPALEGAADRMSLGPALAHLPERERRVILMRFYDHLTQSQIADRLGISQMHVSRLLARTLKGLRAWIEGERPDVDVCRARPRRTRTAMVA